jgi:hypothetical protein
MRVGTGDDCDDEGESSITLEILSSSSTALPCSSASAPFGLLYRRSIMIESDHFDSHWIGCTFCSIQIRRVLSEQ